MNMGIFFLFYTFYIFFGTKYSPPFLAILSVGIPPSDVPISLRFRNKRLRRHSSTSWNLLILSHRLPPKIEVPSPSSSH